MRGRNIRRGLILTISRVLIKVAQIVKAQAFMQVAKIANGEAVTGLGALDIDVKYAEED